MARATRRGGGNEVDDATKWLQWGAGPRAGQMLVLAAKARAVLHGRLIPGRDDLEVHLTEALDGLGGILGGVSLDALIDALRCLPGIGPKSAQRIAYHLLQHERKGAQRLSETRESVRRPAHHLGAAGRDGPEAD